MENKPCHVFVVEDDSALRDLVSAYLQRQGLAVSALGSAEELARALRRQRPDLVVLDIGLPGQSGLDFCRQLRAHGDPLPVLLLTARGDEVDRVLGLELGADDYLSKPFSQRELLARIRAVLRRVVATVPASGGLAPQEVPLGAVTFLPATRSLVADGELQVLSTVEFALLNELVNHPHQAVSRERLLAASHGQAQGLLVRTVDVGVMRLRKRVEPDPAMPRYIQTVRGQGYMFVPHEPARPALASPPALHLPLQRPTASGC
jgi:two-component system phosphate regulon response regulator OmpR